MGLAFIGTRYGGAEFFASEVVYKAELEGAKKPDDGFSPRFISYGPISAPVHRPVLDNAERVVGKAVGAYAVVVMKSGHVRFEYVDVPTIQRIRQLSDNPDSLMYTKLWTEGYRKIPIRRIAKLINTTEPRMLSAIDTLDRYEGITFEGDSAEVPHGTGEAASSSSAQASATREIVPAPSKRSTGLSDAMSRARARYDEAELVGDPPPDYAPGTEPEIVAPETEAENPHAFQAAPSRHPPGALEWFGDQLSAATSRERLEEIKIEALRRRVDTGEDANTFRAMYSQRARELREASAPRPDPEPGDLFGGVS